MDTAPTSSISPLTSTPTLSTPSTPPSTLISYSALDSLSAATPSTLSMPPSTDQTPAAPSTPLMSMSSAPSSSPNDIVLPSPVLSSPDHVRQQDQSFRVELESHKGVCRDLGLQSTVRDNGGSQKPPSSSYYKVVDGIPVRKDGTPCATWKGYAVLDSSDNTRSLTCIVAIDEWVHLKDNMVQLYDKYNNSNGELSLADYILYRKNPAKFNRTSKRKLSGKPVRRSPCLNDGVWDKESLCYTILIFITSITDALHNHSGNQLAQTAGLVLMGFSFSNWALLW